MRRWQTLLVLGAIVLGLVLIWLIRIGGDQGQANPKTQKSNQLSASSLRASGTSGQSQAEPNNQDEFAFTHPPDSTLRAELANLRNRLEQNPGREQVLQLLREFTLKAFSTNPDAAAAALLEFLRSGADMSTCLGFVVGEAGVDEWPTLRAFLLDLLGKIDPEIASWYALETVIPARASTVEYAVSLQILWNHGGAEKPTPELTQAWLGLLRQADWSTRPDSAWLESLDFASRISEAIPEFLRASTEWLADPENEVERVGAVDLALERIAAREPIAIMEVLLANPSLLGEGRGEYQRSQIFARANLRDTKQQRLLADYVDQLDPASREAQFFFAQFPCHNFSVAPGLSGQAHLQSSRDVIESDRAALTWLESQRDSVWAKKQPDRWINTVQKMRQIVRAY